MPSTTVDVGSAWGNAGKGFGSIFTALAQAPLLRQRAQQEAALRAAQTYAANMQGNKYGAAARGMEITNNYRTAPIDTTAPPWMQNAQRAFQWAQSSNPDQIMSAMQRAHQMGLTDMAVANPQQASSIGQAIAAAAGKPMYNNVGNTGAAINTYTGATQIANPQMFGLHREVEQAKALENAAQANAHNAHAALRERETIGKIIENGAKALDFQRAQQGLPPIRASNGIGAAEARVKAQMIMSVMNDPTIAAEEKEAAIERAIDVFERFVWPNASYAQQPALQPEQAITPTAQAYANQMAPSATPAQPVMTPQPVARQAPAAGARIVTRKQIDAQAKKMGVSADQMEMQLRAAGYLIEQ